MGGISQYASNLKTVEEDSSYNNQNDSTFVDDMSRLTTDEECENEDEMSTNEDFTIFSKQSDYKSNAGLKSRAPRKSSRPQTIKHYGATDMGFPM